MPIGSFSGALLHDLEAVSEQKEAEIRVVVTNGIVSIIQEIEGNVAFGTGKTLELAYAAYCRDRLKNHQAA